MNELPTEKRWSRPAKARRITQWVASGLFVLVMIAIAVTWYFQIQNPAVPTVLAPTPQVNAAKTPAGGKVLATSDQANFTIEQTEAISRQNFGSLTPKAKYAVQRTVVQYRSFELDGTPITIYARIYQPVGVQRAPIFAFGPGTTGVGDVCAASIEQPQKANWANYESHMLAYAGQGYAAVITDYEGMRDASRIHHYMVGALEGRAMLDSVRALINLNRNTKNLDTQAIFLSGYSQGGHSAFWGDEIAASYAPELKIKGVIGFGPVMDVRKTLTDVTRSANINWFGPYVLTSYNDFYGDNYDLASYLLPRWLPTLTNDVLTHCIDTVLPYWGHDPHAVYTPEFIEAMGTNFADPKYTLFNQRLEANIVGNAKTTSAKLINQGSHDNVVLPGQQTEAMTRLCANSKGSAALKIYQGATHYNTMILSFTDTLNWMQALREGRSVATTCGH